MPLRRIFSINLITHLTHNIQYKAGNRLYDALIDPRETIIISMTDIHEDIKRNNISSLVILKIKGCEP